MRTGKIAEAAATGEEPWDLTIRPKTRLLDLNIRELYRYRDLVGLLVKRDLASVY